MRHAEYEAERIVPDFFFFALQKVLYEVEAIVQHLSFIKVW